MKFTKAKTEEFRFNITDLIPSENAAKATKNNTSIQELHSDSGVASVPQNYETNNICEKKITTNCGVTMQPKGVGKMTRPGNVRTGYKVLLGDGTDGAALDLDTFLRVQQWVEDISIHTELELTQSKTSTFRGKDS